MKRYFPIVLIVLCAAGGACKKAKGPTNATSIKADNNLDSALLLKSTIDGRNWFADSAYAYLVKNSGNDSTRVNILITATRQIKDSVSTISFYISNYIGVSTYPIEPPVNTATYYDGARRHYATSGVLVVSSISANSFKGTFSFIADSIEVDGGYFSIARP